MDRTPIKTNPALLDVVVQQIQKALAAELKWLDHAFGKAERLATMINGRRYYLPNVYVGNNDYQQITPDTTLFGNYAFCTFDDPQEVEWYAGERNTLRTPFNIIVWVDMRRVLSTDDRNTEAVKQQILRVLNGGIWLRNGKLTINRIFERAENVFAGFSLDEVDNQYLMHPFAGWRFSGTLTITDSCI